MGSLIDAAVKRDENSGELSPEKRKALEDRLNERIRNSGLSPGERRPTFKIMTMNEAAQYFLGKDDIALKGGQ
jgi:hypothetical protein